MATTPMPMPPAKRAKKSSSPKAERHSIQLTFTTEEDIALFNHLESSAKADRRPLPLYVLLQLHSALPLPPEAETD